MLVLTTLLPTIHTSLRHLFIIINMPSLKTLLASAAMAYLATAKTIKITATSDNKFDPEEVEAEKNDVLEFHFEPKNHSVVAGDYRYPCSPLDMGSGFFSGFLPTDSGSAVSCIASYDFTHHLTFPLGQDFPGHCQRNRPYPLLLFSGQGVR